jgi:hypothetical protein
LKQGAPTKKQNGGIKGTHVDVEPFHLFRYFDEQSLRYGAREDLNGAERLSEAMRHFVGHRLTYNELTGKGTDLLHQ